MRYITYEKRPPANRSGEETTVFIGTQSPAMRRFCQQLALPARALIAKKLTFLFVLRNVLFIIRMSARIDGKRLPTTHAGIFGLVSGNIGENPIAECHFRVVKEGSNA
jgi:hypothetical protein